MGIDKESNAEIIVPNAHHKVHDEEAYVVSYTYQTVAPSTNAELWFSVPSTHEMHAKIIVNAGGAMGLFFLESITVATTTNNGTTLTAVNYNQGSSKSSNISFFHTPTNATAGTLYTGWIPARQVSGNNLFGRIGGVARDDVEWVFTGQSHMIRASNLSGVTIAVNIVVDYYQVEL